MLVVIGRESFGIGASIRDSAPAMSNRLDTPRDDSTPGTSIARTDVNWYKRRANAIPRRPGYRGPFPLLTSVPHRGNGLSPGRQATSGASFSTRRRRDLRSWRGPHVRGALDLRGPVASQLSFNPTVRRCAMVPRRWLRCSHARRLRMKTRAKSPRERRSYSTYPILEYRARFSVIFSCV